MDKIHYELEVQREGRWYFNQRQPTLEKAQQHYDIVNVPSDIFTGTRIVEVRTTRTVIKNSG